MNNSIKHEFRHEMMARRDALTQEKRESYSERIAEELFAMDMYRDAQVVLSYASFRSEVITDGINRRVIADGKALYLPRVYPDRQ
ncbi:MAG: hypothetical protein J5819_03930, partial [Eubacterium sp.]|nr:hypothetical protein [Eubacterium sp.]